MDDTYDFIIVGAGSAGCALANRLSARKDLRVLLLESGGRDNNLWLRIPIGIRYVATDRRFVWKYETDPEPELKNQRLYWPHGRVIGGSSSVNGMLFVRGEPSRYDAWRDSGCAGWGYGDVLPYFKRMEACAFGDPEYRGREGPIPITQLKTVDPISKAFVRACRESGLADNPDYNGAGTEGVARMQLNTSRGLRRSASTAYLRPAAHRRNLTVLSDAHVNRVAVEGNRATGVSVTHGREARTMWARREVILSAGALHSPQLLELSGVGNGDILKRAGVEVVRHLPGVGENLRDHLHSRTTFECNAPCTANDLLLSRWRAAREAAKYLLWRGGLFATPSFRAHAFTRAQASPAPDVRIQCALYSGASRFVEDGLDPFSGFHLGSYFLFPESRGAIHLQGPDPLAVPRMRANYLDHPRDREVSVWAMKATRRIADQPALRGVIVRETRPGPDVVSDDDLLDYIRSSGQTSFHPIGSCRMGADRDAVVDHELRVHGVAGLRVADASVMPFHVSSNTNAPSIMIGEKAADLILDNVTAAT